jgi:hypothetical protein
MTSFSGLLPALFCAALSGQVLRIDSHTGATTTLASGQPGKNCLTTTYDNRLITTVRSGTAATGFHYHLAQINPFTGAETVLFANVDVGDLRAMASGNTAQIFAVRDGSPSDLLVRIDLATGAVTVIGPTGFTGIQGLDFTGAGLRAWDLTAGLLHVNSSNGLATDPFPGIGGPAGLQYVATDPTTFNSYVGGGTLYRVDVLTGVTSAPVAISGNPDLRGVEFTTSLEQRMGDSCVAAQGFPILAASGPFGYGQDLVVQSNQHAPGALGVHILGFSNTQHAGQALPFSLDAMLGTTLCRLYTSIDGTVLSVADSAGVMTVTTPLPPALTYVQFFVQHATFEPVPGGMSWTYGLRVRPGL